MGAENLDNIYLVISVEAPGSKFWLQFFYDNGGSVDKTAETQYSLEQFMRFIET